MRMYVPVAATALAATLCGSAHAFQTTIQNTTDKIAYNGSSTYGFFGGSDRGGVIDDPSDPFDTKQIVVTETNTSDGLNLKFDIYTQFSGTDLGAYYADLFLRAPSTGYSTTPFNYAITLGDQSPNGGIGTPGLYTDPTYKTSQDIWSARTNYIYGGEYVPQNVSIADPQPVPTVVTGGTLLPETVTVTRSPTTDADGYCIETVSLTLTGLEETGLHNGFDVLWGTGDWPTTRYSAACPSTRSPNQPHLLCLRSASSR